MTIKIRETKDYNSSQNPLRTRKLNLINVWLTTKTEQKRKKYNEKKIHT